MGFDATIFKDINKLSYQNKTIINESFYWFYSIGKKTGVFEDHKYTLW